MAKKSRKDLIPKNPLKRLKDDAKELKKLIDALVSSVKMLGTAASTTKKAVAGAKPKDVKSVREFNELAKRANQIAINKMDIDKQVAKEKIRLQQLNKQINSQLKEEILLEKRQLGTLEKLDRANKELREERKQLNLETKKGVQRNIEINRALDRNNAKIEKNSDKLKQQKIAVGRYSKALGGLRSRLLSVGAAFGVGFGVAELKGLVTESVGLFRIQQKAIAQVEAGLKSTGNQAGRTIDQLKKQAADLQKTTLFGDEEILQGATAQLLTFTNISGEQFDRTQQAALDLATRLDGDLKSASIQLGKALNDPVANLSALSRSGIQFSTEQKKVIKSLTETGRLAEAQTLILDELNKQYGGSAEAAAKADGGITQLGNAIGDAKETFGKLIVEALQPTIESLKEFFANLTEEDIKRFIANLKTFAKVLVFIGKTLLIYKARLIAIAVAQKLFATSTGKLSFNLKTLTKNLKDSTKGTSAFGSAFKGIGIGLAIALVTELAIAWLKVASGAQQAAAWNDRYSATTSAGNKTAQKNLDNLNAKHDRRIQKIKETAAAAKVAAAEAGASAKELALIDEKAEAKIQAVTKAKLDSLDKEVAKIKEKKVLAQEAATAAKKERDQFLKDSGGRALILTEEVSRRSAFAVLTLGLSEAFEAVAGDESMQEKLERLDKVVVDTGGSLGGLTSAIAVYRGAVKETKDEVIGFNIAAGDSVVSIEEKTGATNKQTKSVKDLTAELLRQAEVERTTRSEKEEFDITRLQNESEELLRIAEDTALRTGDIEAEAFKAKLAREKQLREAIIERQFIEAVDAATSQEDVVLAGQRRDQALENLDNEILARKVDGINTLNDAQEVFADEQVTRDQELADKEKDIFDERLENRNKFLKATEQAIINSIDKRIKKVDEESNAAQKQFDFLSDLAKNGNIKAEQSLAAEAAIIREAQLEKERLEKRKQDILLVSSVLQAYNSNLAAGDDSNKAFAKAITSTELLTQFIGALPGFFEGTEDTGDQGIFRDKHGAITGYTHKNERVINANDNARIGGASNEEVARTMEAARLGKLNDGVQLAVNNDGELINEMRENTGAVKSLEKTIEGLPQNDSEAEELVKGLLLFKASTTKGNRTTQRTYRVQ